MRDLGITQEYVICAVNGKGKISGFSTEKLVCLVASGLLELQLEHCVEIEKKAVRITDSLPQNKTYLKPLYDFLNQPKLVKIEKLLEEYNYSITDRRLSELLEAVGASLKDCALAQPVSTGLFKNKTAYVPSRDAVHYVIDLIRAELLEDTVLTEDIAALVVLLDKSKLLKTYFSDFEQKEI